MPLWSVPAATLRRVRAWKDKIMLCIVDRSNEIVVRLGGVLVLFGLFQVS